MPTLMIWWLCVILEALLIVRGLQQKLIGRYPFFYSYLIFVFLQEFVRMGVFRWFPSDYLAVYWTTEFLGLVIGSAVIFEIYRVALREFPGAAKMARNLLALLFAGVFLRAIATPGASFYNWFVRSLEMLERECRVMEALALAALVVLFLWYAIPFGRNLQSVLFGYAAFVVVSVIEFTLLGNFSIELKRYWLYVPPITYLIVLNVWIWGLWSAHPEPLRGGETQFGGDYELLVESTYRRLRELRTRAHWTVIP